RSCSTRSTAARRRRRRGRERDRGGQPDPQPRGGAGRRALRARAAPPHLRGVRRPGPGGGEPARVGGSRQAARGMRRPRAPVRLAPFTLVGATTRPGMLSAPLRERFGIFHHLDFYSDEELTRIVTRSAMILEARVDAAGAREISRRSRGTPRIVNRLLRRVRDYAQGKADGAITEAVARDALQREGVDARGVDKLARRFLGAIVDVYGGGPVGIDAVAPTINDEAETLSEIVEPYLLKIGFIAREPRGRRVTREAYAHLGKQPPAGQAPGQSTLF